MKFAPTLIFLACVVIPWTTGTAAPDEPLEERVISSDEIREAAVSRLSDILLLLDGWTPTTVDGFTWLVSPAGLGAYENQSWIVMVDGIRIDINQFGVTCLNRLPLSVSQIDSVVVLTVPQLYAGEFAGAGLIDIRTHRGGSGYSFGGAAAWGNETNDPGPYRYTEFATPNVDKVGPDFSLMGSYGTEHGYLYANYLKSRHYATDAATRRRNTKIAGDVYPQMNVGAPFLSFGGRILGGEHYGFVGYSEFEDFFFFKPFGREIPVVSYHTIGGIGGRFERDKTIGIDYRATYTINEIGYRQNSLELDFDWTTRTVTAGVEASHRTRRFPYKLGAAIERIEAETGYALVDNHYWVARFYGESQVKWTSRIGQVLAVSTAGGEDGVSLSAMTAGRWVFGSGRRIGATVAYVERKPEEDGRVWYWRERGYDFLGDAGVEITSEKPLGTSRKWAVDTSVSSSRDDPVSWRVNGFYRDHSNLYLEIQQYQFDPDGQVFNGPPHLGSGRGGGVIGYRVAAETRRIPGIHTRTAYRYQKAISGDRDFRNLWDAVPRHHFKQWVSYSPVRGFRLWAQLNYFGRSEWRAYRDALEQSNGIYRSTVNEFMTLDAAIEKWLWQDRGRGSLIFKNLLGETVRYHPIGASFDLSVFVQLELRLGSASK